MLNGICSWIQKMTGFLMIISLVLTIVPGQAYKKYIQFFAGLMILLLCCTPILNLLGMGENLQTILDRSEYELIREKTEQKEKQIIEMDLTEYLPEEINQGESEKNTESDTKKLIKVEDVSIE